MTSVALIGGDGAGKTTIAQHLTTSSMFRAKYLYMGISAQSSNRLLPTSRMVLLLKRRAYRKRVVSRTGRAPRTDRIPATDYEYSPRQRGTLWTIARLLNRFAEAWYRQIIALTYQARGYVVVYDRHFLFDGGVLGPTPQRKKLRGSWFRETRGGPTAKKHALPEAVYRWALRTFYPRPDLVIFLETPGAVLYARKGEASAEYLDRQAQTYLAQAASVKRFVRLDASQPLDDVKRQAADAVSELMERPDR
jgi:thymidylate kinase